MKRHKDVPRKTADVPLPHGSSEPHLPHAAAHDASVTTRLHALHTRNEPASPIEAAAALIQLSLHESNGPVEDLSGALARIAQLAQSPTGSGNGAANEPLDRAQLAREVAVCVESLQFHDRLTQQLTQVRNLLAVLAFCDESAQTALHPLEKEPDSWLTLLENLRARFTSDSHRILFNLLLPGSGGRGNVPALHANEGSVELF